MRASVLHCGLVPYIAPPPPSRFAAASLQFNGGSKNTRNCNLKCPCGHSRQQKAARMTPRMSSLRPCCLVPQTGRQWPWRISTSLSAVSKKEPPKKGWSAHALSFDLPVFTCHGYCVSRAGGGKGQPEGNGSWGGRQRVADGRRQPEGGGTLFQVTETSQKTTGLRQNRPFLTETSHFSAGLRHFSACSGRERVTPPFPRVRPPFPAMEPPSA